MVNFRRSSVFKAESHQEKAIYKTKYLMRKDTFDIIFRSFYNSSFLLRKAPLCSWLCAHKPNLLQLTSATQRPQDRWAVHELHIWGMCKRVHANTGNTALFTVRNIVSESWVSCLAILHRCIACRVYLSPHDGIEWLRVVKQKSFGLLVTKRCRVKHSN